jgi:hypothetical protein
MADELNLPPTQTEAVAQRLALALAAQNWPAYRQALGEVMGCPSCTAQLIGTLVTTLTLVFDQFEPGWQAETAERLAVLIDSMHGFTVSDEAIFALLDEEGTP